MCALHYEDDDDDNNEDDDEVYTKKVHMGYIAHGMGYTMLDYTRLWSWCIFFFNFYKSHNIFKK